MEMEQNRRTPLLAGVAVHSQQSDNMMQGVHDFGSDAARPINKNTLFDVAVATTMSLGFVLLAILGLQLAGRPFAVPCTFSLSCGSTACMAPSQGFGFFLALVFIPCSLFPMGKLPQLLVSAHVRNGGPLSHGSVLLGIFLELLACVLLAVFSLVYLVRPWEMMPHGKHDQDGGVGRGSNKLGSLPVVMGLFSIMLLVGMACVLGVTYKRVNARMAFAKQYYPHPPTLPLEPVVPHHFVKHIMALWALLFASLVLSAIFAANWHYPYPYVYFPQISPDALWNWKITDKFVFKLFSDTLVYFVTVALLATAGALAHVHAGARRIMHTRLRVRGLGKYNPYPHGLTVGEAVCVVAVIWLYVYFYVYFRFTDKRIQTNARKDPHKRGQVWARVIGNLANLSFALLLLPVARNSIWVSCFGIPFERAIKHHRAFSLVGYATVTLHMLIWFVKWGLEGSLANNMFNARGLEVQPRDPLTPCELITKTHFNNFTIVPVWLGWILLTAMIGFAMAYRRTKYNLFRLTHYYSWVYYFISVLHSWGLWQYTVVGMFLYAIDKWVRLTNCSTYSEQVELSERDGVTVLRLPYNTFGGYFPGQYAFVNIPDISMWQWHPFTISSAPTPALGNADDSYMTFHIKSMGKGTWTGALATFARAHSGMTVEVKVDGPYGKPEIFSDARSLVLVAGGIGVTPMHSLLSDLHRRVVAGHDIGRIQRVHLIWSSRSDDLFCLFARTLSEAVHEPASHAHTQRKPKCTFSVSLHNSQKPQASIAAEPDYPAEEALVRSLIVRSRPNLAAAISRACTDLPGPREDIMVMSCGPQALLDEASEVAFNNGCRFHAEVFNF